MNVSQLMRSRTVAIIAIALASGGMALWALHYTTAAAAITTLGCLTLLTITYVNIQHTRALTQSTWNALRKQARINETRHHEILTELANLGNTLENLVKVTQRQSERVANLQTTSRVEPTDPLTRKSIAIEVLDALRCHQANIPLSWLRTTRTALRRHASGPVVVYGDPDSWHRLTTTLTKSEISRLSFVDHKRTATDIPELFSWQAVILAFGNTPSNPRNMRDLDPRILHWLPESCSIFFLDTEPLARADEILRVIEQQSNLHFGIGRTDEGVIELTILVDRSGDMY